MTKDKIIISIINDILKNRKIYIGNIADPEFKIGVQTIMISVRYIRVVIMDNVSNNEMINLQDKLVRILPGRVQLSLFSNTIKIYPYYEKD